MNKIGQWKTIEHKFVGNVKESIYTSVPEKTTLQDVVDYIKEHIFFGYINIINKNPLTKEKLPFIHRYPINDNIIDFTNVKLTSQQKFNELLSNKVNKVIRKETSIGFTMLTIDLDFV